MESISVAQARNRFAEIINRVRYGGERIALMRRGKPIAALISPEELEILERLEEEADLRAARRARRDYQKHGGIPLEAVVRTSKSE